MNKQIEEMAKVLCVGLNSPYAYIHECKNCIMHPLTCSERKSAEILTAKGYRKSTDVAREIFEEIDKIADGIRSSIQYGCNLYWRVGNADSPASIREMGRFEGLERIVKEISELKKKYESEGADDGRI